MTSESVSNEDRHSSAPANAAFATSADMTGTIHALGTTTGDTGPLGAVSHPGAAAVPPGQHVLYTVRGPGSGSQTELVGVEVTVGRSPEADIFLDDITVSRIHAIMVHEGDSWTITDRGSLNGTYVNRKAIDSHILVANDEIQIGKYRFKYLYSAQD